jgi:hypothetical protein
MQGLVANEALGTDDHPAVVNPNKVKAKGKQPARTQKPILKQDRRNKDEIRASIKLGPNLETRKDLFEAAIKDKDYASTRITFGELEPKGHDMDAFMQQADAGKEKSMDEKARDKEYHERKVVMPHIATVLNRIDCQGCVVCSASGARVVFKGCNRSADQCCCQTDKTTCQIIKDNDLNKDDVLGAICSANMLKANLDKEERRVYRVWGWTTSEYDPEIEVCDGDRVERGLQPKDAEAVTAPQLRLPDLSSTSAWDPKLPCVYNAPGCKGKGFQVQMLSQVHDVHFKQTADREAADRVVIKMVVDMCQPCGTKAYEALQKRVGTSISCTNGECKLRAGIIDEDWMNEFCARKNQNANEINGNIRYSSDKFFANDLKLARRLFEDPKYSTFGEAQARRMVADAASFSYYAESREREAIGTTFAFVEACEALEVPWDHSTKQEFLDRAKLVPRNHIVTTVADHVVTHQKGRFGVSGKRDWEAYLTAITGKLMFPEPLTGICLLLRLKNWEANGRPVLDGRLVDRISSTHPASSLFDSALEFHNVLDKYIHAAGKAPYRLNYTGTDASLCSGTNTGSYWTTMQNITKAAGKSSALLVSLVARFMKEHGTSAAHQTQPSQVHINGDYYAPPCADLYGNNNVTAWERFTFYARAYGLAADHKVGYQQTGLAAPFGIGAEVKLDNFITEYMPTLFLEKCKDKYGSAAGFRVVPSQIIESDGACLPKYIEPSGSSTSAFGAGKRTKAASAAVDAAQYAHWHRCEPLGSPTRGVAMFVALQPFAGLPSGVGMSCGGVGTERMVNLVPIYEMPDGGVGAFPRLLASTDKAMECVIKEYSALVYEEQVLDKDITDLNAYCTKDVDNRLMLWAIGRERYKKLWYEWLKFDRPEQFAKLVGASVEKRTEMICEDLDATLRHYGLTFETAPQEQFEAISLRILAQMEADEDDTERWEQMKSELKGRVWANWMCSMHEDPGGTAGGRFKVKDDYDAYVKEERHKAHRAFVLEEEWFKAHPLVPEPTHFGYFCSMHKIDPDERWPTMRSLRLQYAEKQMLYHESELLKLRDGVPGDKRGSLADTIDKERKSVLRCLKPKASQAEKDRALEAPREMSALHEERLRVFNRKSKRLDLVIKSRYGRWQFQRDNLQLDAEREQIEAIDGAFENHLDDRFDGGLAHEFERRCADLTKHAFKRDDRALARAELELTRQEETSKLNESEKNHKHERPEAMAIERATERFFAAENDDDDGDKGIDPVINNRIEDMQLSNLTNARKHVRKAVEVTTKPDEIAKESLEFPANGNYAYLEPEELNKPYYNPRLRGLDWIDENGNDKYAAAAKRAKH